MKTKKINYLIFAFTFLTACSGNSVYFDETNNSVKTCNEDVIQNISVEVGHDLFQYQKIEKRNGSNEFKLFESNPDYEFIFEDQKEKFKTNLPIPNSKYIIEHNSNGDAAPDKIFVETDSLGKVINYTNKNCN